MIRNKYNGYGFDGTRLYHDPISLSIAATKAGAASSAAAAAAATKAAAATAGTAAAQTAALETAKQAAIQTGMKQAGVEAAKQAGIEATKQAGVEAAKQSAVEASKQGIAQGFQKMIPQAADDVANLAAQGADDAANLARAQSYLGRNPTASLDPTAGGVPSTQVSPATTPSPANTPTPAGQVTPTTTNTSLTGGKPPVEGIKMTPDKAFGPESSGIYKGVDPATNLPYETFSKPSFTSPADSTGLKASDALRQSFGTPPEPNALEKGVKAGLDLFKKYPTEAGLTLMAAGQYMNQPKGGEDKDKYKSTVDMSDFQPTVASVEPFKPSYEYQKYAAEGGLMKYAVGGPVETMSAQNAVGGNMMYPQAGLQTALYSNPMVQRPESVNVISPGEGPAVGAYSGEQKFASGGLSAAERREYGLRTRGERASRNLSKSYEEMEAEREKEMMKLLGERSDPGIIPRSRTQQMSSPFSAAMAEHARLGKKSKVPVVPMPKTNLGDIDNYMDIPIEAAGGGIMHGLGGYSDGGRLLRGPGDGVSDSIPAVIGKRQPARLADGEFVIPARIVSELGNGSTEAGARKLYAMMERVQNTRKKSIGKKKVAVNSKADKHLPA
jgi:hypothetical protein